MENTYGFVVRVVTRDGADCWLGQRVYMAHRQAIIVKHNKLAENRYSRVYVLPATADQYNQALSIVSENE